MSAKSRKKRPTAVPVVPVVSVDITQYSEKSRQSYGAGIYKEYKEISYVCRSCRAPAVFTAEDQKHTYEIAKAHIAQSRVLCEACWKQSLRIADELKDCEGKWAESKKTLQNNLPFLTLWLELLATYEWFDPHHADIARKNMLKKLIESVVSS